MLLDDDIPFSLPRRKKIDVLETENAELLFKSAINEIRTRALEDENANILLKLALLEVGRDV